MGGITMNVRLMGLLGGAVLGVGGSLAANALTDNDTAAAISTGGTLLGMGGIAAATLAKGPANPIGIAGTAALGVGLGMIGVNLLTGTFTQPGRETEGVRRDFIHPYAGDPRLDVPGPIIAYDTNKRIKQFRENLSVPGN